MKSSLSIPLSQEVKVFLKTPDEARQELLEKHLDYLSFLARAKVEQIGSSVEKPFQSAVAVESGVEIYLPLSDLVDLEQEKKRLFKKLAEVEEELERTRRKVNNEDFLKKAPGFVVEKEKEKFRELDEKKQRLEKLLNGLKE